MSSRQEYMYWQTVRKLIHEKKYSVLSVAENLSEIWLESKKEAQIVRVVRHTFNWANEMEHDANQVYYVADTYRKRSMKRNLRLVNIYISDHEPVNDWTDVIGAKKADHIQVQTFLISRAERESYEDLYRQLQLSLFIPETDELDSDIRALQMEVVDGINEEREKEKNLFNYSKPFFSYLFLAVQIVMYLVLELNGGSQDNNTLLKYGAKFTPYILAGEWWRLVTPIFLHIGFLHLLMNSFALYSIGPLVERIYGRARFVFIYLLAGITGVLGSMVFSTSLSAGASGAIFGLFGALLYLGVQHKALFFRTMGVNVIGIIVINLIYGFSVSGIDNAGHIGGMIGGFLAAAIVALPKDRNKALQIGAFVVMALLVGGSLVYSYSDQNLVKNEDMAFQSTQQYVSENKYEEALKIVKPYEDRHIKSGKMMTALGVIEFQKGNIDASREDLEKAIKYDPSFAHPYYVLGVIYANEGDLTKATEFVQKAVDLNPDAEGYQELLDRLKQEAPQGNS
ncbi:rhomboid family intramembrane serine protease [Priestia koreensis]|uniref:rhomboid family intramembrane serine protease n=1 Tax=Priestia koreensis TaxID=284581 RepID=UPI00301741D9